MSQQLQGWAEENKDNDSMCPLCRTKIEKNKGCNHMTCAFCNYEFCWACGASATKNDNHYVRKDGASWGSCGVKMMDEDAKPGKIEEIIERKIITWWLVLCIIFFPITLVFYFPCLLAKRAYDANRNKDRLTLVCAVSCNFLLGLLGDLIMVPFLVIYSCVWLLTCQCCFSKSRPARANEERARQNIKKRLNKPKGK